MTVNAASVAYTVAGSLILFSGIKGSSLTDTAKSVLSGKLDVKNTEPLGTVTPSTTVTNTTGGTNLINAPVDAPAFADAVLSGVGAPVTPPNVKSIESWIGREGGGGANNPLNSTLPAPGSTGFNSVGVQNYPTPQDGITATVSTLENGNYGDILMLLRSGGGLCGHQLQGLSTWSGGGYSSVC